MQRTLLCTYTLPSDQDQHPSIPKSKLKIMSQSGQAKPGNRMNTTDCERELIPFIISEIVI